jgi:hypothetical protein
MSNTLFSDTSATPMGLPTTPAGVAELATPASSEQPQLVSMKDFMADPTPFLQAWQDSTERPIRLQFV